MSELMTAITSIRTRGIQYFFHLLCLFVLVYGVCVEMQRKPSELFMKEALSHKTGDNNFCVVFLLLLLLFAAFSYFHRNIDLDFGHTFNSVPFLWPFSI